MRGVVEGCRLRLRRPEGGRPCSAGVAAVARERPWLAPFDSDGAPLRLGATELGATELGAPLRLGAAELGAGSREKRRQGAG